MATNNSINANSTTPLPIVDGGTQVTSVTTAPTATAFAGWDANKNLSSNSFIEGFATTATAGGTTTLTIASAMVQEFTGTLTQTVVMPVANTLVAGFPYKIINNSSGVVTINSSGSNLILSMAANTTAFITLVLASGTTAASWNASYVFDNGAGVLSITGTANQVIASASTGAVTLSLPQSIATTSAVQFNSVNFGQTSLNFYQEGTWTPADGSGASLTFTGVIANYTRIGRMVVATCTLTYPSTVNGSNANISGLPFTCANSNGSLGGLVMYTNSSTAAKCLNQANTTTFNIFNSAGAQITNTAMSLSTNYFQLTYFV